MSRIFVIVEGGLIQNVMSDDGEVCDLVVVDYDTDGYDPKEDEVTWIPQVYDGVPSPAATAYVSRWSVVEQASDALCLIATSKFGEPA